MSLPIRGLGAVLLLHGATTLPAQEPRGYEVGMQGVATFADPEYGGAAIHAGLRPGGKTRLVLGLGAGGSDGRLAGRGEFTAQLLLSPRRARGVTLYGFGGIAGTVGPRDGAYILLGAGLESAPAAPSGWAVELGVGGGVRVAAGWRWRWLRR